MKIFTATTICPQKFKTAGDHLILMGHLRIIEPDLRKAFTEVFLIESLEIWKKKQHCLPFTQAQVRSDLSWRKYLFDNFFEFQKRYVYPLKIMVYMLFLRNRR